MVDGSGLGQAFVLLMEWLFGGKDEEESEKALGAAPAVQEEDD